MGRWAARSRRTGLAELWCAGRRAARARGRQARGRGRQVRAWQASGSRRGRARGRASWAAGARAGQGCALGALDLFLARFDSVLFLSQFLDIVRELGS